jgi:tRNA splicing endonuclease
MKNYLSLSEYSTTINRIAPRVAVDDRKSRKSVSKKANSFVVLNSDNDYGFYVKRLVRELDKYAELREVPKSFRKKSIKEIKTGDVIVFGDAFGDVDYDYRVANNVEELNCLDGRAYKSYDMLNDFGKIISKIKGYAEGNKRKSTEEYLIVEEEIKNKKRNNMRVSSAINIVLGDKVYKKAKKRYVTPIAVLRPEIQERKVTIFDNWVKVGYNQYDIFCNLRGEEFVYIDGAKFTIHTDRYGKKYLEKFHAKYVVVK